MSDPLMTWERRAFSARLFSGIEEVDRLIDSQRRFACMLSDEDIFYSRTDLRMFIDRCRNDARRELLSLYCEIHGLATESAQDLVLHAAAELRVSPYNTNQLIRDYGNLINHSHRGSLPLHLAAGAVGTDHIFRLNHFLTAYPKAVKQFDANGILPMQIALLSNAEYDVMELLVNSYPPVLTLPFFPRTDAVSEDIESLVGMQPFHIACCRNYSLDVIFKMLLEGPDCLDRRA